MIKDVFFDTTTVDGCVRPDTEKILYTHYVRSLCLCLFSLFLASDFPEKSETQESGKLIVELTLYTSSTIRKKHIESIILIYQYKSILIILYDKQDTKSNLK